MLTCKSFVLGFLFILNEAHILHCEMVKAKLKPYGSFSVSLPPLKLNTDLVIFVGKNNEKLAIGLFKSAIVISSSTIERSFASARNEKFYLKTQEKEVTTYKNCTTGL
ncbi:Hypothetical predicted protein [Olea europaea subsp. europaea]|uniref:Uncharacterized protein n=1 Tax=Olea europaea subsp. europaea TaxID=158383 RepID=A0A8S0UHP6_OLEEU|nr:Hypothetical predicted protein [Olea europaea subsp. europaea]